MADVLGLGRVLCPVTEASVRLSLPLYSMFWLYIMISIVPQPAVTGLFIQGGFCGLHISA